MACIERSRSVRVGVIETPTQVWKTRILPLNYTRVSAILAQKRLSPSRFLLHMNLGFGEAGVQMRVLSELKIFFNQSFGFGAGRFYHFDIFECVHR